MERTKLTQMKVKGSKRVTFDLQAKEVEVDMQTITGVPPASPVQEPNPTTNTKSSSRKRPRKAYNSVRRSARINILAPALELTGERAPEEVVVSDSEEEDKREEPQPQPQPTVSADKSLEEKVDNPAQLVTEPIQSDKNENWGVNDLTYRSLYFDSQKKVEALMEEKLELCKKLENAYGKIEVFEKFKDIMRFSLLSKGAAPAPKLPFDAIRGAFSVSQEQSRTSS